MIAASQTPPKMRTLCVTALTGSDHMGDRETGKITTERFLMNISKRMISVIGIAGLTLIGTGLAAPASADNGISGTVDPGSLTKALSDASFGSAIPYSFSSSTQSANTTLSVADMTGTGDGWDVKVSATSLSAAGTSDTIPNTGLSFSAVDNPVHVAGQAINGGGPVRSGTTTASLDTSRSLLEAQAGSGEGSYTQALVLAVQLPALLDAGTYTGTFTVTSVAPTP